jgi:hypothetical protein
MVRRTSTINFDRIRHIQDRVTIVQGDLLDQVSLISILQKHRPDEVYNLAAQSFVPTSFEQPVLTGEFTALGVTRILDAIRIVDRSIRFYQASSSEMFGKVQEVPQRETTPFYPRSPYGVGEALWSLDHGQLPRELQSVRLLRHSLQPRVAPARPGVCDAQGHAGCRSDQAGLRKNAYDWVTWMPAATGVGRQITYGRCG